MEQIDLVRYVVQFLDGTGIPYMVVGSYASGAYGDPRFTQDIDIVIDLTPSDLDRFLTGFPEATFYASREAIEDAVRSRSQFNVIQPEAGLKIDFMIGRTDAYGREQLRRRHRIELLDGVEAFTARPEDVILWKLVFYKEGGSEKHCRDITSMFKAGNVDIDREYIDRWADFLEVTEVWDAVKKRLAT